MALNRPRSNSNAMQRGNSPNVPRQVQRQHPRRGSNSAHRSFRAPATPSPAQNATPRKDTSAPAAHNNDDVPLSEPTAHEVGMSPASRYYTNLRVLCRHDPHITSIFDQFAHVTLYYQHSEDKYERAGYEGAMFFFERDIEPKYGLFILNRQGMHDYIRYLWPDDVVEPIGELVWISTVDHSKPSIMNDHDKTAGLWAMTMDVRESLAPMMARLMSCIKDGVPYPEEYRYGPDRIAPQQTCTEAMNLSSELFPTEGAAEKKHKRSVSASTNETKASDKLPNPAQALTPVPAQPQPTFTNIDQLLSRLSNSSLPAPVNPAPPPEPQSLTGMALLNTLFASVSEPSMHQLRGHAPQNVFSPQSHTQKSINPYPQTNRSFPYAQTNDHHTPSQAQPHHQPQLSQKLTFEQLGLAPAVSSPPEDMEILSPKPSAAGLPQILTADVIHELMGLPRSSSCTSAAATASNASTSPSSSRAQREHERERIERGYFADRGEDSGGISESSTNAEPESADSEIKTVANEIVGRLSVGARPPFLSAAGSGGSMKGDATPRARGELLRVASPIQAGAGPPVTPGAPGRGRVDPRMNAAATVLAPAGRPAFQSDAELWPGNMASTPGHASGGSDKGQTGVGMESDEQEEVVELDFSEISKLSDMRIFEAKSGSRTRRGKRKVKGADKQEETDKEPEKAKANGIVDGAEAQATNAPVRGTAKEQGLERTGVDTCMKTKTNGVMRATAAQAQTATDIRADVVGAALRSALLSSSLVSPSAGVPAAPLDRNSFMREVLTLIHSDGTFVDRMYSSYTELLNSAGIGLK